MAKKKETVEFDRKTNEFIGLTDEIKNQLLDTYKGINLDKELKKMSLWLTSEKGLHRKGHIGFIMNWLNKAYPEKSPTNAEQIDLLESKTPLGNLLRTYLQGLWKNREHILEFNTIRR